MDKKMKINIASTALLLLESDSDEEILININLVRKKRRLAVANYITNIALIYSPDDFKSHFRLRRETFEFLLNILAPYLKTKGRTGVGRPTETPEKQLLVSLCMLANQEVFRSISERFDISKSTAWSYVHKVCFLLSNHSGNFIKWPREAEAIKTMREFRRKQGFMNVLGAIDGTDIPISPPSREQNVYCNRNKYHSIILQAVCNANYIFTDVFIGYPGSTHDARVFRNSDLGQMIEENPNMLFPANSHILRDSAYKNTNYVLTPYRDNGHLTQIQKNYNFKHSSTRVCIEQSFGLLKGRFRILKHVNIYRTELIPPLVLACCVLHNICMQKNDMVEPIYDPDELQMAEAYSAGRIDNTGLAKRNYIASLLINE
ncbi:putative nuclease HARBI1 [Sitophilus oryzae]|uniref:Nuclease HARBI1 n=1 Tax=Sitophilus oryzae TaxID=7048 RepID=A0A6J2Y3Y1_SITOR|nr:putative nuclease HARBI1 [Sitophilus oryzae]